MGEVHPEAAVRQRAVERAEPAREVLDHDLVAGVRGRAERAEAGALDPRT
ncbi:MAG: hypothetical protein U0325_13540 [Polyangiales bacterium]